MNKQKLLEQDFSLGKFLNSIHIGILFIDEEGNIQSPNKACIEMFRLSVHEMETKNFTTLLSEKSVDVFAKVFQKVSVSQANSDSEVEELKAVRSNGEKFPIELNINSTLTVSDQLYIIVINDISKRKRLEKEIEVQIEDKEEIQEELEKIQELSELKSRFVTMASHEFRTPLAGVLSSLNLAQRYLDAEEKNGKELLHKGKIENHFSKIRESVGNLTQILNEFLSLGKLEEGKVSCHFEEIDLEQLVSGIPEDFQRLCKKNQQIKIVLELQQKLFITDMSMLRNVLNNLISNAIKYSNAETTITVSVIEFQQHISLSVADEGQGIPKDEQKKLFGRFFRARNATNIQGTGLGLNIVKRYVEMMGGKISFESELDKGTTFNVLLPKRNEI